MVDIETPPAYCLLTAANNAAAKQPLKAQRAKDSTMTNSNAQKNLDALNQDAIEELSLSELGDLFDNVDGTVTVGDLAAMTSPFNATDVATPETTVEVPVEIEPEIESGRYTHVVDAMHGASIKTLEAIVAMVRGEIKALKKAEKDVAKKAAVAAKKAAKAAKKAELAAKASKVKEAQPKYVKTIAQMRIAGGLIKNLEFASAPHAFAEDLAMPLGTVKSYIRRLKESGVITVTGKCPFTKGFTYESAAGWDRFVAEYKYATGS